LRQALARWGVPVTVHAEGVAVGVVEADDEVDGDKDGSTAVETGLKEAEAETPQATTEVGAVEQRSGVQRQASGGDAVASQGFPAGSRRLGSMPERSMVGQEAVGTTALGADGCGFPADPLSLCRPEGSRVSHAAALGANGGAAAGLKTVGLAAEAAVRYEDARGPGPWSGRFVYPEEAAGELCQQSAAVTAAEVGIQRLFCAGTDVLGLKGL